MSEREREKMRTALNVHEWEKEKCKIMIWLNRERKQSWRKGARDSGRKSKERHRQWEEGKREHLKNKRQRNKTGGVLKFELLDHWLDRSVS